MEKPYLTCSTYSSHNRHYQSFCKLNYSMLCAQETPFLRERFWTGNYQQITPVAAMDISLASCLMTAKRLRASVVPRG